MYATVAGRVCPMQLAECLAAVEGDRLLLEKAISIGTTARVAARLLAVRMPEADVRCMGVCSSCCAMMRCVRRGGRHGGCSTNGHGACGNLCGISQRWPRGGCRPSCSPHSRCTTCCNVSVPPPNVWRPRHREKDGQPRTYGKKIDVNPSNPSRLPPRSILSFMPMPLEGVVRDVWRAVVLTTDPQGRTRISRIPYEMCVLQALRDQLRCKELWVVGADRYRNPDDDVPSDFAVQRRPIMRLSSSPRRRKISYSNCT